MNFNQTVFTQIKINKLSGHDYDFVLAQICVLNNMAFADAKKVLDTLIQEKKLATNDTGQVFIAGQQYDIYDNNLVDKALKGTKTASQKTRVEGKLQGTRGNFAFLIPFDSELEDIFVGSRGMNGALNGDSVEVEVERSRRGVEGVVTKILSRGTKTIVGKIELLKNNAFVISDDVKFGKDIYIPKQKTLNANQGDKVVVRINKYFENGKNPEGEVIEVLGAPNKIETEVLSIIRSYNLFEKFPKRVVSASENMPEEVDLADYPNRLDLTKELLFTIDGEDARDLDDAISLTENQDGTKTLGVHIADVGEYVTLNSVIDNEAFKRGTSVYFPGLVLPMLPKTLSNGICSLNEMVNRLALSVFITFDKNGVMQDHSFHESVIKSKKRFTYTEIDLILNKDKEALERNKTFTKTIVSMNELAKKLEKQREVRGAIDFDLPEVQISLNDLGDVLNVTKRERNDSHKLIESFMIAANEAVAEFFNKKKLPFIYRIHEKPDIEKMNIFINFVKSFGIQPDFYAEGVAPKDIQKVIKQITDENIKYVVNKVCLRSLKKAKYYPECLGHFGLASTFYTHFTSPIRRYPDLTIHRIIKSFLNGNLKGNKLTETKHFVVTSSQVSSEREVLAERVERDVDDLYKVFYMSHHIGEVFSGRINSVTNFGVYVELDNTVEGLLKLDNLPKDTYSFNDKLFKLEGQNHTFKIGQNVNVLVARADILAREVDFVLAPEVSE